MLVFEKDLKIPIPDKNQEIFSYLAEKVKDHLASDELAIRFVISGMDEKYYNCEIGVIKGVNPNYLTGFRPIFEFKKRKMKPSDQFNAVLMIPTGIGAKVGGHAGDAGPAAKLLASLCDNLVTHPNVVNGSDINELPSNGLYVEGSSICRLLMGTIGLRKVVSNRFIYMVEDNEDPSSTTIAINAVNAARATYGVNCSLILKMPPLETSVTYASSGRATGTILKLESFINALQQYKDKFDVVGISTLIDVGEDMEDKYYENDGKMLNPWGGVEALFTHAISLLLNVPSAHAPMFPGVKEFVKTMAQSGDKLVDPRLAAEWISLANSQCLIKGLNKSPQLITDPLAITHEGVISAEDISCLIMPEHCLGLPTLAALNQGITVISVRDEENLLRSDLTTLPWAQGQFYMVNDYMEAAGLVTALRAGISPETLQRPLKKSVVKSGKIEPVKAELNHHRIETEKSALDFVKINNVNIN